jgi:penicillin-binding protein 1A
MAEHMKVLQAQFDEEWKKRNRNPWVDDDGQEIRDFLQRRIRQTDAYKVYSEKYGEKSDSLKLCLI